MRSPYDYHCGGCVHASYGMVQCKAGLDYTKKPCRGYVSYRMKAELDAVEKVKKNWLRK